MHPANSAMRAKAMQNSAQKYQRILIGRCHSHMPQLSLILGRSACMDVCSKRLSKQTTPVIFSIACMLGAGMRAGQLPAAGACKAGRGVARAQGQGKRKAVQAAARGYPFFWLTDMPMRAVISIECMPEACVLVKGKPRVRMVPEKAAEVWREDAQVQRAAAKEEAIGSGTADPAADMFKSKARPFCMLCASPHWQDVGLQDVGGAC